MALSAVWACVRTGMMRWSPALPWDTATCQETGVGSELGRFWYWTVGKSLLFFLRSDCCLHKLWSFCTVCVPFFPFMQSFSALAAEICLVEKTHQRAASEGGWSPVFYLCIWTFEEKNFSSRDSFKALSYLKSMYLQPLVSGIILH